MKKIILGNEPNTKALTKQCAIHSVSNSVCPQCGKEKAPKEYTCLKCYMKRIKTN